MTTTAIRQRGAVFSVETRTGDGVLFATMTAATLAEAEQLRHRVDEAMALGVSDRDAKRFGCEVCAAHCDRDGVPLRRTQRAVDVAADAKRQAREAGMPRRWCELAYLGALNAAFAAGFSTAGFGRY